MLCAMVGACAAVVAVVLSAPVGVLLGGADITLTVLFVVFGDPQPTRRVAFICGANDAFTSNIWEGIQTVLKDQKGVSVERPRDTASAGTPPADRELALLRSAAEFDAVLLRPSTDRTDIFVEVTLLAKAGVTVVLLGSPPLDSFFRAAGVPPLASVASTAWDGALVLTEELRRLLRLRTYARVVFLSGPDTDHVYWGSPRIAPALYLLARDLDPPANVTVIERSARDAGQWPELLEHRLRHPPGERILICTNSDGETLTAVSHWRANHPSRESIDLVGYGGERESDGRHRALASGALATVDLLPYERGRRAAQALMRLSDPAARPGAETIQPVIRRAGSAPGA
jgi:hypothetical protein